MIPRCSEYARLAAEVSAALQKLCELTAGQLNAFQANDHETLMRLDRDLENAFGEKERTMGAMRQHVNEHKCQS